MALRLDIPPMDNRFYTEISKGKSSQSADWRALPAEKAHKRPLVLEIVLH
jgi:hypothetical protein